MTSGKKILILKAQPRSEILQASALLKHLKTVYEQSTITWITSRRNGLLFENIPSTDEVLFIEEGGSTTALLNRKFDIVISLDSYGGLPDAANLVKASKKYGIYRGENGNLGYFNAKAKILFQTEEQKEYGQISYQRAIMDAADLMGESIKEMDFRFSNEDMERSITLKEEYQLHPKEKVIVMMYMGLKEGLSYVSPRFFSFLGEAIVDELKAEVILIAGAREKDLYYDCLNRCPPAVVDGGCLSSFRDLKAVISMCDVIVGKDSLCLQMALAAGKNVVLLKDMQSQWLPELYDRGSEINPHKTADTDKKHRLEYSVNEVIDAIKNLRDKMGFTQ